MYSEQSSVPLQPAPLPAQSAAPLIGSASIQTVIAAPQKKDPVGEKNKRHFKNVGWIQVVLGTASIVLGITNICIAATSNGYSFSAAYIGCGIWSGIVILVCGILGLRATKDKTKCSVVAGLVMTIISTMFTTIMFSLEMMGALIPVDCYHYGPYGYGYYDCNKGWMTAIHAILVIISLTSLVVAIIHSGFSCASLCCRGTYSKGHSTVVYMTPAYVQQPGSNPTGAVQMYPNSQFVPQQYQVNQSYPSQPQYYFPQPTTSSANPYPPQAQPQMGAPPSYFDADNTAPPVQEKQPL